MSKEELTNERVAFKTRQSLVWYTTVPFAIHFLRFANSIVLARLLLPRDFGIIGIITVILYYCDSFSDFGFGKAIVQKKKVVEQHYLSYFSFNILVSLSFFVGAYLAAGTLAGYYEIPELENALKVYALLFLITAVGTVAKVKLTRALEFKTLAIIEGLKVVIAIAISLTLAVNGFAYWSIIYSTLIAHAIAMVLLTFASQWMPRFSRNLAPLKDLLHFGVWDFIGAQFKLIGESADKLIIGKVLGASALGFYDKAMGLAKMPSEQISMRLSQISFSSFSRLQEDRAELRRIFLKMVILNATILLPILVGLIWVAEEFVFYLLGEKWMPMVASLQIFGVAFVFASFSNPVVAMNLAIAQVKKQTLVRIVLTGGLIVALLKLSPLGIEYASIAILIFFVLLFFVSFSLLSGALGLGWSKLLASVFPPILLVSGMVSALAGFDMLTSLHGTVLHLLASVVVGGLSYGVLFLLLPFSGLAFLRRRVLTRLGLSERPAGRSR